MAKRAQEHSHVGIEAILRAHATAVTMMDFARPRVPNRMPDTLAAMPTVTLITIPHGFPKGTSLRFACQFHRDTVLNARPRFRLRGEAHHAVGSRAA